MPRRSKEPKRISVSVRLTEGTANHLRAFIRHHAGHPLFLQLGPFVERAILREINRIDAEQTQRPVV
jgi:hypothetical protein